MDVIARIVSCIMAVLILHLFEVSFRVDHFGIHHECAIFESNWHAVAFRMNLRPRNKTKIQVKNEL